MSEFGSDKKPENQEEESKDTGVPKPPVQLPSGFAPLVPGSTLDDLKELPESGDDEEELVEESSEEVTEEVSVVEDPEEEASEEDGEETLGEEGEERISGESEEQDGEASLEETSDLEGPDVASIFAKVERESELESVGGAETEAAEPASLESGAEGFSVPKVKPVMLSAAAVYGRGSDENESGEVVTDEVEATSAEDIEATEEVEVEELENETLPVTDEEGLLSDEEAADEEGDPDEKEDTEEETITVEEEVVVNEKPDEEPVGVESEDESAEETTEDVTLVVDESPEGEVTEFESEEEGVSNGELPEEEVTLVEETVVEDVEDEEDEDDEEDEEDEEGEEDEEDDEDDEINAEINAEIDDFEDDAADEDDDDESDDDGEDDESDEDASEKSVLEILAGGELEEVAEEVGEDEEDEPEEEEGKDLDPLDEESEPEESKIKVPDPAAVAGLVAKGTESKADEMEVMDPEKERERRRELFQPEKPVSRWAFWRRSSKRDQQLARVSEGYLEMVDLVRAIRNQLESQNENNLILRDSLSQLPEAMKGLESFSKSQRTVGKALKEIHGQLRNSGAKDHKLVESMEGFNSTLKGMDDTGKATLRTFDRVQERMRDSDIRMENLFQKVQNSEEKVSDTMVRLQRNMAIMQSLFLICLMIVIGVLVFTVMGTKQESEAPKPPVKKEEPVESRE